MGKTWLMKSEKGLIFKSASVEGSKTAMKRKGNENQQVRAGTLKAEDVFTFKEGLRGRQRTGRSQL